MLEPSLGKSFSEILVLSSIRDEIVLGARVVIRKTLDLELKDGDNKNPPPTAEFFLAGWLPKVSCLQQLHQHPH